LGFALVLSGALRQSPEGAILIQRWAPPVAKGSWASPLFFPALCARALKGRFSPSDGYRPKKQPVEENDLMPDTLFFARLALTLFIGK
jgi:hypothetical protein